MSAQTEASPAIEPSPIPGTALAANKQLKETKAEAREETKTETKAESKPESVASSSPASALVGWREGAASQTTEVPATGLAAGTSSAGTPALPEELPAAPAPTLSPVVETTPIGAEASPAASVAALSSPSGETEQTAVAASSPAAEQSAPPVAATPATTLAPARVGEPSQAAAVSSQITAPRTLLIAGFLLAATFLIAWVIVPELNRRGMVQVPVFRQPVPAVGPRVAPVSVAPAPSRPAMAKHLSGGPRQVSLQLKASEPSLRRSVLPSGKPSRASGTGTVIGAVAEAPSYRAPEPVVTRPAETVSYRVPEPAFEVPPVEEPPAEEPIFESVGPVIEQEAEQTWQSAPQMPEATSWPSESSAATAFAPSPVEAEPAIEPMIEQPFVKSVVESVAESTAVEEPRIEVVSEPPPVVMPEFEPIGQGQPVPYQMPVWTEPFAPEPVVDTPPFETSVFSTEPSVQQTIIPVTMPDPIQIPTARTPAAGAMPQGAMHTAVQLTFTFEIASMQLTPTFKMGALQVRPTSKVVTMRLAPSQQPQPGMNLQVTFEIGKIQPAGGALGSVRLTPTQAQRPPATGSPSFTVAGLQLVPNFESAPVQLTPTGQAASVLVTAPFQITTVEFSPSFEIASIALNSSSKQVLVQLPGPAPAAGEGSPMFEIANLQLTGSGDIGMMQLNLVGHGQRRA